MNSYERIYNILIETRMPEDEALKKGLIYNDPKRKRSEGSQSDASVRDKPVVVKHGSKRGRRTVRIKSAGEGDHLARRAEKKEDLKASMQSRQNRKDKAALALAAAGHKDAPRWAKNLSKKR